MEDGLERPADPPSRPGRRPSRHHACRLGGARTASGRGVVHLADRSAFGRRLADARALRFRLAGIATDLTADRARQVHGGYGRLSAYGIEKIVRDQRVHQILEGTNEIMHVIVARGLAEAFG